MPKVRRDIAKPRGKAAPPPKPSGGAGEEAEEAVDERPLALSRGQRKRRAKREGFIRNFEFVNSSLQQDQQRQEGALADLASLAEAADEAGQEGDGAPEADPGKVKRPMSRRAQTLAAEREMNQYQQVIKVDAFQKDPLGALEQHLRNSIKKQKQEEKERQAKGKLRAKQATKVKAGKKQLPQLGKMTAPKGVIKNSLKKKGGAKQKKRMEVD
mmetsp:Transcript_90651/g.252122  ORF Transcript_90651/g.252122 Transcript_90651/m.252122 type:complete len:213 (-) Transcript_90651:282-920(-)